MLRGLDRWGWLVFSISVSHRFRKLLVFNVCSFVAYHASPCPRVNKDSTVHIYHEELAHMLLLTIATIWRRKKFLQFTGIQWDLKWSSSYSMHFLMLLLLHYSRWKHLLFPLLCIFFWTILEGFLTPYLIFEVHFCIFN